jgi:hypothetical protein
MPSSGMLLHVALVRTDVSEERREERIFLRNMRGSQVTANVAPSSLIPVVFTPWLLVRKRTIPTERSPLVDEI